MAGKYRVLVSPTDDPGSFSAELPYDSLAYTETLNDAGQATVTLPLRVVREAFSRATEAQASFSFPASTNDQDIEASDASIAISGGFLDVRAFINVGDLTSNFPIMGNWFFGATKSWVVFLDAGSLEMWTSGPGGGDSFMTATESLTDVGIAAGQDVYFRWLYDCVSSQASFFWRLSESDPWSQFGAAVSGSQTGFNTAESRVAVNKDIAGNAANVVYWAEMLNDGLVARCDANDATDGTSAFVGSRDGLTWTPQGGSVTWTEAAIAASTETVTPFNYLTESGLDAATHCLWIERDGVLIWGGIVWGVAGDVASNGLTLTAADFHSYFRRRLITSTAAFSATDQTSIAGSLVTTAEAKAGSLGLVTAGVTATGVLRDRTYYFWEYKNVGEAIEQLAAVENGFDFYYEVGYSSGVPTVTFRTSYPSLGRSTDYVMELGSNVELLSFVRDGSQVANQVYGTGEGEGPGVLRRAATFTAPDSQPLLQTFEAHPDIKVGATLKEHLGHALSRRHLPIVHYSLRLTPEGPPALGGYLVGDIVRVKGSYGYLDEDGDFRIVSRTVSVSDGDGEVVDVALSSLSAFENLS